MAAVPVAQEAVAEATSPGQLELGDLVSPEFRTAMIDGRRKGLRLEKAFWTALAAIASWKDVKRHRLISHVVGDAERQDLNSASALRSFAIHAMQAEVERLTRLNELSYSVELLQRAPVPSFAVDRAKRVVRVNAEFNHFLRILFAETSGTFVARSLQLNLETPVSVIFDALRASGEHGQYMLNIVADGRARRTRTRIVAVPPHNPQILVGYIQP